ncbi:hydroxysqualene dehydroxylase HpnE [Roseospirillum parvum]|uniref:hydroxysqualene dehydroxylase HpnE n=1 Tax=Roseospirillum parvum TaxID=83401 RepID=UPI0015A49B5A|nr:hydroxysqualene dehydroxylase HpnE [Roseospirillum parvum]
MIVLGAGLAGLSAAVAARAAGHPVTVLEAAPQPGGRCRSFHDATLGRLIDNGNHLIMGANPALFGLLGRVGGPGLTAIRPAAYPYLDLLSGRTWTIRPGPGPLPLWLARAATRPPDTAPLDYLPALRLLRAGPEDTVSGLLGGNERVFEALWRPLAEGVLNTAPEEAAAAPLARVLAQTLLKGEAASRPYVADSGLGPALIAPCQDWLEKQGVELRTGCAVSAIEDDGRRVTRLLTRHGPLAVDGATRVILALSNPAAHALRPDLVPALPTRPIVNAHFRLDAPPSLPGDLPLLGLTGGTAHWLFGRGDVLSVTVSAASGLAEQPAEAVAAILWADCAKALGTPGAPLPPCRVIKEKRATIAHTPASERQRPGPATRLANLILAGDWTRTGLPCTLEGAVRSGQAAAERLGAG